MSADDVRRGIVLSYAFISRSNPFVLIDLSKWLYTADSLDISEWDGRHAWFIYGCIDRMRLFKISIEFYVNVPVCINLHCYMNVQQCKYMQSRRTDFPCPVTLFFVLLGKMYDKLKEKSVHVTRLSFRTWLD